MPPLPPKHQGRAKDAKEKGEHQREDKGAVPMQT